MLNVELQHSFLTFGAFMKYLMQQRIYSPKRPEQQSNGTSGEFYLLAFIQK